MTRPTHLTRRTALKLAGAAASAPFLPAAFAQTGGRRHGLSIFGDLAYPPDFTHFKYANPDAPKGGRFIFQVPYWLYNQNPQTFNTMNGFVTKGDAPPRVELTFASLMAGADDEPDSVYGLIAEAVEISDDGNELRFFLRPEARFHDGSALTARDAAFSLDILKKEGNPQISLALKELVSAEAAGDHELVVRFSGRQSSQLKLTIAALPIFSADYYASRKFSASTMEPPLGSGPYRVGRFEAGRFIEYQRVEDYWARDLPVLRGMNNFDVIRIEFFRDRTAGFEAFKKGDVLYREESTAKVWSTEYNFPAILDGRVEKDEIPREKRPSLQAWYYNTRRSKFADPRTRQAIGLAFDFEWVNANLFYGLYSRTASYFENSPYAAEGLPSAEELELLEPWRDQLPEAVFREPYVPPVSDGSGRDRIHLREAVRLLGDAGWTRKGSQLVDEAGEPLTVEFLINDKSSERILGKFVESLKTIGAGANIRLVDPAQYQARQNEFDFDIISAHFSLVATPMEGMKSFLTSESANLPGSSNFAGIREPVVDALLEKALASPDRETHRTALRAIDRVLRAGHYITPEWHSDSHRVAAWDMFDRPDMKPDYAFSPETTWWYDSAKAARIGKTQ